MRTTKGVAEVLTVARPNWDESATVDAEAMAAPPDKVNTAAVPKIAVSRLALANMSPPPESGRSVRR